MHEKCYFKVQEGSPQRPGNRIISLVLHDGQNVQVKVEILSESQGLSWPLTGAGVLAKKSWRAHQDWGFSATEAPERRFTGTIELGLSEFFTRACVGDQGDPINSNSPPCLNFGSTETYKRTRWLETGKFFPLQTCWGCGWYLQLGGLPGTEPQN